MTRTVTRRVIKSTHLKVKEAMSSVDKSTIEDLQKKESTLRKCYDPGENRLSESTMLVSSS